MTDSNTNLSFDSIKGCLDSLILRAIQNKSKYGLEIYNEITTLSSDLQSLKQPTFYNILKRLENIGYIKSSYGEYSNGAKRVYYTITEYGNQFLSEEKNDWNDTKDPFGIDNDFSINFDTHFTPKRTRKKNIKESALPSNNNTSIEKSQLTLSTIHDDNQFDNNVMMHRLNVDDTESVKTPPNIASTVLPVNYFKMPMLTNNNFDEKYSNQILQESLTITNTQVEPQVEFTTIASEKTSTVQAENKLADINPKFLFDNIDYTAFNCIVNNDAISEAFSKQKIIEKTAPLQNNNDNIDKIILQQKKPKLFNRAKKEQLVNPSTDNNTSDSAQCTNDDIINIEINNSINNSEVNYVNTFDAIYNTNHNTYSKNNTKTIINAFENSVTPEDYEEIKFRETNFVKLKQKLAMENIKLKQYVKSNTSSFYVGRYYYSNQLFKNFSYIMYILFAATTIGMYFLSKSFGSANLMTFLIIGFTGLILPIFGALRYNLNPKKRIYTRFNLNYSLITSIIVTAIYVVITVLVAFFGFKASPSNPISMINPLIIPLIYAVLLPTSVIVYALIYNSKRYHLK